MPRKYAKTVKLSRLEREILSGWSLQKGLKSDLIAQFIKEYESELEAEWSCYPEFDEDDVVVGRLVENRFDGLKILSVWGDWMCAGGVDFYLADVDYLDRQVLFFHDSGIECTCASRLSVFTTDALKKEMRGILGGLYIPELCSAWDDCESVLVPKEEVMQWRDEIFADEEEEQDEEDLS